MIASFCLGGTHAAEPNYREYFLWPLFAVGYGVGVAACVRCLLRRHTQQYARH
jgi:hypothetical protein